ncbi:MAG: acyl-CoA thioesterase [Leptolyngbyaceae cyanobacterium]
MAFVYHRTIRFQDTDAAGVVYFANVLSICHEAYEAALADAGIELQAFFGKGEIAVPIVHADIDFRQPFHCGDRIAVHLTATAMDEHRFAVQYEIIGSTKRSAATAQTIHICINVSARCRCPLPQALQGWLALHSAAAPNPVAADD